MKEIIAANLLYYRKSLGLSQEQLAEQTGISRQSVNNYENGKTLPDSKILSTLAIALGVTMDELLRSPDQINSSFQFRAGDCFKINAQFTAQILRILETYHSLEQSVGLLSYTPESTSCYQLEGNQKYIQQIATYFRHRLGLGDAPIANLFQAVEEIGLKVVRESIPIKGFFGLSTYSEVEGALVIVNTHNITIERQLFTLAHEIGHLIFHRAEYHHTIEKTGTQASEKVANYFAAHLLVPQLEFERMYSFTQDIIKLKQHFRVSYLVILTRLAQMGKINFSQEKAKIQAIYQERYGEQLSEIMELPPVLDAKDYPENERYELLIWQALKQEKLSELKAAELLHLTVEQLRIRRQETELYAIA